MDKRVMKEFKGSPTPWEEDKRSRGHVHSNGRSVASCMGYSTNADDGQHIQESYANAKLIAAAPDLLDALQDGVNLIEYLINTLPSGKVRNTACDFNIIAQHAINKALS